MKKLYQRTFEQVLAQTCPPLNRVEEQRRALASRCSHTESEVTAMTTKPRRPIRILVAAAAVAAALTAGTLAASGALGSISLLNVSRTAALTSLIIPLIVAGVPIIDTFSAIVRRKRAHISIGQADKGHIHHRLIQEGYNQKQAVLLIYAWCIMLSAGAAAINQVEVPMRVLIFTVLAIGSAAFAKHLHLFEPVLRHHYNKRTHEDELVTPDDPAFKQEEQAAEERKEERHHKL